jgi:hypothetical protein
MVIYRGRMVIDISRNKNSLNFDFQQLLDFYPPVWDFMVKKWQKLDLNLCRTIAQAVSC